MLMRETTCRSFFCTHSRRQPPLRQLVVGRCQALDSYSDACAAGSGKDLPVIVRVGVERVVHGTLC